MYGNRFFCDKKIVSISIAILVLHHAKEPVARVPSIDL